MVYSMSISQTKGKPMTTATKTYTAHTRSCDTCKWQVPMIYVKGALGAYVSNESLRELRKHAKVRDVHEAEVYGTYCLTCNNLANKS
jgi:hypothetical protein